jgi:hypothetical protein
VCDAAHNAAAVAAQQGEPVAAVCSTLVARAGAHVGSSHTLTLAVLCVLQIAMR